MPSSGAVLSIKRAKALHVFRHDAFGDDAPRRALRSFGVAFSRLDSRFIAKRVCCGAEGLGPALEVACSERQATATVATEGRGSAADGDDGPPSSLPMQSASPWRPSHVVRAASQPAHRPQRGSADLSRRSLRRSRSARETQPAGSW